MSPAVLRHRRRPAPLVWVLGRRSKPNLGDPKNSAYLCYAGSNCKLLLSLGLEFIFLFQIVQVFFQLPQLSTPEDIKYCSKVSKKLELLIFSKRAVDIIFIIIATAILLLYYHLRAVLQYYSADERLHINLQPLLPCAVSLPFPLLISFSSTFK